jgi:hypothetical protein
MGLFLVIALWCVFVASCAEPFLGQSPVYGLLGAIASFGLLLVLKLRPPKEQP